MSTKTVHPYLNFDGRCEEAIAFYQEALDAKVAMKMLFKDNPDGCMTPGTEEKVMHARLEIGDSVIFLSDGRCTNSGGGFKGVSLSLTVKSEAEADQYFNALAAGGEVGMPLMKTFFSPRFGMVEDKFGLGWMVLVQ